MAFIRLRFSNGIALSLISTLSILNLRTGQYLEFDFPLLSDVKNRGEQATALVTTTQASAQMTRFGWEQYSQVRAFLTKGSNRRDLEAILGAGVTEANSNRVRWRSENERTLAASFGEDGALLEWHWQDEPTDSQSRGEGRR